LKNNKAIVVCCFRSIHDIILSHWTRITISTSDFVLRSILLFLVSADFVLRTILLFLVSAIKSCIDLINML